jgi:hypothetical protein
MFIRLLGLKSFDSPKRPLAHKQVFFSIIFGGVRFISITTITPTTYLGSWALVISIIIVTYLWLINAPSFLKP